MLHDSVVLMGINANVGIMGGTVIHDTSEYSVSIWVTGDTVDYMIWLFIIKPLAFINPGISRLWGCKESKVAHNLSIIFNHKAAIPFHVSSYNSLRWITFSPLVHISRLPHYFLCSIHDCHNISHIRRLSFSDNPVHVQNSLSPVSSIAPWHFGQVFMSHILILSLPHCKHKRPTSLR